MILSIYNGLNQENMLSATVYNFLFRTSEKEILRELGKKVTQSWSRHLFITMNVLNC